MSYRSWVWFRRIAALGIGGYYGWLTGETLTKGLPAVIVVWLLLTLGGRIFWGIEDWVAYRAGQFDPVKRSKREWQGEGGPFTRWARRMEASGYGKGASSGWDSRPPSWGPGKVFLGRASHSLRPVGLMTEKHMVTFGGTGSGKSSAVMVPNLCLHPGSVLCLDPKGELARITSVRRGEGGEGVVGLGQEVHVLDPFGITGLKSGHYNLFDELAAVGLKDPDRPVSYAGKIAEALVKENPHSKDPYWDNAARTLIRGLVLYLMDKEQRNLGELRRLLMEGDVEGWSKRPAELKDDEKVTPFWCLFERMRRVPEGPYRDTIAGAGSMMLGMGPNQQGGVLSTAQEHTAFLDAPEIKRMSASSDFLLDDLRKKPVSVYLCLNINKIAGKEGRWLRMFVVLFIDMMMSPGPRPKTPVLLAIDEFPALGHLEGMSVCFPVLRSYGARVHICAQDLPKVKAVYPDDWQGMIGGAEAVQLLGLIEAETVDFFSKRLGRHTVQQSQAVGGQPQPVFAERQVMEADEVARFLATDLKNQIVWRGSRRPLKLKVAPYYEYLPRRYWTPDPMR